MSEQSLPTKAPVDEPASLRTRTGPTKDIDPAPQQSGEETQGVKAPLPESIRQAPEGNVAQAGASGKEVPPQRPRGETVNGTARDGTYLRLRVQVDEGRLSVVGSQLVHSELAMSPHLSGPYAYEVIHGDELLHAETVPDIGEYRSFPTPGGKGELEGHHRYPVTRYEFAARIPVERLTRAALPEVSIVLHRVKEPSPMRALTTAPLGRQFERELRELGRIEGLSEEVLPPDIQLA